MWLSHNKALALALVLVSLAIGLRFYNSQKVPRVFDNKSRPVLGTIGSEHSHMSMMVVIGGAPINLYQEKYVEKSDYAHIHAEDTGGYFIHKHAKGVTLPYFLSTLGWELTGSCLTLETRKRYCSGGDENLWLYVNRKLFEGDLDYYELGDGDKILIDYGTSTLVELMLEANGIPDIPDDLVQHG